MYYPILLWPTIILATIACISLFIFYGVDSIKDKDLQKYNKIRNISAIISSCSFILCAILIYIANFIV